METFTRRLDAEEAAILQDHILGLLSTTKETHLGILTAIDEEVPEVYSDYEDSYSRASVHDEGDASRHFDRH
nr:MAG TPA: hypothetical protein [Caudoviricetes sp.]